MRFVAYALVAWVVLTVFSTVFAISAKPSEVRVMHKWIWLLLILFVPIVGAILYLTIGRPLPGKEPKTTTLAPDDDPEFLRRLAEQLKKDDDEKPNE
ncbi:MAG: hypothetical protein RIS26_713 [Actinomycetota bacterium]|jgi:hypothetical protein